jgi:conjugative transfer signal peptidase TraF
MFKRGVSRLLVTGALTPVPQRSRSSRCPRPVIAATIAAVIAFATSALVSPTPRLVWNASASAPLGLYWVARSEGLSRGEFVLAELPDSARKLAAERGYLPERVPLVKRIAALSGDRVCAVGTTISINDHAVAERLKTDSRGRELPAWEGCRLLQSDEVFLLMAGVPDSFDGRYFGPVARAAIIGKLVPLWIW